MKKLIVAILVLVSFGAYAASPQEICAINQIFASPASGSAGPLACRAMVIGDLPATTGTGSVVLSTSPTLVTPALGTPSSGIVTNLTGTAAGVSIGGNAATATTATNLAGGTAGQFPYQTAPGVTGFSNISQTATGGRILVNGAVDNGVDTLQVNGSETANTFIPSGISTKTAAYSTTRNDRTILANAATAAFTVTLVTPVGNQGLIQTVKKIDSSVNVVTITPVAGTIDGAASLTLTAQYGSITVQSDGTNYWILN